jgi:Starch-binding associating with outer membrane
MNLNKAFFQFGFPVLLLLGSCQKFDELENNPNQPTNVTPGLVFNGVANSMYEPPWSLPQRWNQFTCCNYNYYGNQEYNWTSTTLSYTTLKNVTKMEAEAVRSGLSDLNPYSALGKFFRAYFFYRMTMLMGDIPMTDALQSLENLKPKYDTQKDIFVQVIKWLDESNTDLASLISSGDNSLTGDIYYGNDLRRWQKAVNTFKLRVLIQLSLKENDAELNIKGKFAEVLSNKSTFPVLEGMIDNMKYVFNNQFNKYPINPDNFGFDATRYNYSSTYLNTLASLKDPRTFMVAEPAGSRLKTGLSPTDYNAFVGASPAQDLSDMSTRAGIDNGAGYLPGEYSFFGRKRFYTGYTAEDCIQIGFPEMCFNIAEAINRGWISGDAGEWYSKGIQASHGFYGIKPGENDVFFFRAGGSPTNAGDYDKYTVNFNWDEYYNQASVKYSGNNADGLKQILVQKYLAFFQNSGWEAYFNFRRTGVPVFADNGPGTGNSGRIPKRYQYPPSERSTNGENLNDALQRQFGGNDDINEVMWVIK